MRRPALHRCVLIGLGRRALDDHLPALYPRVHSIELVGVCDANPGRASVLHEYVQEKAPDEQPRFYTNLQEMLDREQPNLAIISTPHHTHLHIAEELLKRKIPFLKEKPFAINLDEAKQLVSMIEHYSGHMRLCVQRRYHPLYVYGKKAILHLGPIRHFMARYQLNADAYYFGWRSRTETAGGGCVIDMGYHLIDLLYWYFGVPSQVFSVAAPQKDERMEISVEETTLTSFSYENGTVGSLFLSLCEPDKYEEMRVYGQHGYIKLDRSCLKRLDTKDTVIESLSREPAWPSAVTDVLFEVVNNLSNPDVVRQECRSGMEIMCIIESMYRSMGAKTPVNPRDLYR